MWRNIAKQVSSRTPLTPRFSPTFSPHPLPRTYSFLGFSQDSIFPEKFKFTNLDFNSCSGTGFLEPGFRKVGEFLTRDELFGRLSFSVNNQVNINCLCPKSYASVAEAVTVSSTDVEEDTSVDSAGEVQELLTEMKKEDKRQMSFRWRKHHRTVHGMGRKKYHTLKRRQVKIETEAWEQAANEYKELLNDMCKHKLAPNLPYMKSLFLGWFEPLCSKIAEEQELCRLGQSKAAYAKYFHQLPADMMSVITMHKLMGLLMTGGEHGSARVVQAACLIGDAVEQEVSEIEDFHLITYILNA